MRHRLALLLLGLAAIVALGSTLGAFGDSGHRIVGRVAELHLQGSRALTEVRKILRPQETLADATVWPDTIKNPLYEDGDTPLFRLQHPAQDTYHYTNIPFQAARYDLSLPGARPTDIVQITRECVRVLRGTSKTFTPREALRMLAHTVGDMHQPLHAGNAFISASGPLRFVLPEGPTGWRTTAGGNALVYGPAGSLQPPLVLGHAHRQPGDAERRCDDVCGEAGRRSCPWRRSGRTRAIPTRGPNAGPTRRSSTRKRRTRTSGSPSYLGPDEAGRIAAPLADRTTRRLRRPLAGAHPHPARERRVSVGRDTQGHLARPVKV